MTKELVTAPEFKVIDNSIREQLLAIKPKRLSSARNEALMADKTLFMPGEDRKRFNGLYQTAREKGYRLVIRPTEQEGVKGFAFWWEKKTTEMEGATNV
jgi:hypothetical protein